MRTLYLARHGEAAGGHGRYIGDTDLPLSDRGRTEARRLGHWLAGKPLGLVASSNLQRARDTAAIAAAYRRVPVRVHPGLREVAMGAWEGLPRAEAAARFPEEHRARGADLANHRLTGGESFTDCRCRALLAVMDILESSTGDLLIVGHAGLNRTLLCLWMDMPLSRMFDIPQDTGAVNVIEIDGPAFRVATVNSVAHLTDTHWDGTISSA